MADRCGNKLKILEHHPDFFPNLTNIGSVVGHGVLIDPDVARGQDLEAVDAAKQGALSRPRRADHHHSLALTDRHGHVVQGLQDRPKNLGGSHDANSIGISIQPFFHHRDQPAQNQCHHEIDQGDDRQRRKVITIDWSP